MIYNKEKHEENQELSTLIMKLIILICKKLKTKRFLFLYSHLKIAENMMNRSIFLLRILKEEHIIVPCVTVSNDIADVTMFRLDWLHHPADDPSFTIFQLSNHLERLQ
jgi:hypothetical protein